MSARRTFAVVIGALGVCAAACQLVAGIDDHGFRGPDTDVVVLDAVFVGPTCGETPVPPVPTAVGPSKQPDMQLVFALDSVSFPDVHHPYGFDLDGVCTCQKGDPSTHSGENSCALPPGSAYDGGCDFDAGVDNGFAYLVNALENIAPGNSPLDAENRNAICGSENVLLVVDGYNGQPDDDGVIVSALRTPGIYTPNPAGPSPADASACATAGPPYPAWADGTDKWSLEDLDLRNYQANVLSNHIGGYVTNGTLVVDAVGSPFILPIAYQTQVFNVSTPIVTASIHEDDAGLWRLTGGRLAGRTKADDLLGGVVGFLTNATCDAGPFLPIIESVVCAQRDIASTATTDFSPGKLHECDGLSLGLMFTAVSAHIADTSVSVTETVCPITIGCQN